MGTNYYVTTRPCNHCARYDQKLHIGKSSFGWSFMFRGYKALDLVCWQQWKHYLQDKHIRDEYGREMIYDIFVEMIETYKHPDFVNPITQTQNQTALRLNSEHDWTDEQGYSFTSQEFS